MGDSFKGLLDCPCVPLSYDHFFNARGDLVNQILYIISMMPEMIGIVACLTFVSHTPDGNSYRLVGLLSEMYFGIR